MSRTVSFCFDDGFRESAGKIRTLFEARGLAATFCVLAAPGETADPFIRGRPIADWEYWREAAAAGHEVSPHGWAHERLSELDTATACAGLDRTLEMFRRQLPGFDPRAELFHLAYLTAPEPVVAHLAARVLGIRHRCRPDAGLNPIAGHARGGDVDCTTFGDPADDLLDARLTRFLAGEDGWLVLVLHGLDGEGWGPVTSDALARQLDRLADAGVRTAPAGRVMREAVG